MKNKKGDLIWGSVLLIWIVMLVVPTSREIFIEATEAHPYLGGFVKFAVLATMGDLLGIRILKNEWQIPKGVVFKACVWGVLGIMITLLFTVFFAGTAAAQAAGKLPFEGVSVATAFFASATMNLTFGPMMYIYHKFGDLYIDANLEKGKPITVKSLVEKVDWYSMVSFSWLKTCIFVWIPCHTVVFMLPGEYRVLASAFLAILLGILIALSKKVSYIK